MPMKRPKWAKHKRYKIVTENRTSYIAPSRRGFGCSESRGFRLWYPPRTIVTSPNGVCRKRTHDCCRGIHAYTKSGVILHLPTSRENIIALEVYAVQWYGDA